jgi:hypothetical protein
MNRRTHVTFHITPRPVGGSSSRSHCLRPSRLPSKGPQRCFSEDECLNEYDDDDCQSDQTILSLWAGCLDEELSEAAKSLPRRLAITHARNPRKGGMSAVVQGGRHPSSELTTPDRRVLALIGHRAGLKLLRSLDQAPRGAMLTERIWGMDASTRVPVYLCPLSLQRGFFFE